jgi:3-methyladenine DNA glycosylase AlkD
MAGLAVKAKAATDEQFEAFLPLGVKAASDERAMVRKGVSWALRSIGKRNARLRTAAIRAAAEIRKQSSPAARSIARDVLWELLD